VQEPGLADWLKLEHRSESVCDVHMDIALKSRTSKLVYVPGFLIDYQYGENQHGSIEIVAQHHQALIAAAGPESMFAETHYSPQKAQITTMAAALAVQAAAVGGVAAAGPADAVASAVTIDSAFWAFLAASAAGVLATPSGGGGPNASSLSKQLASVFLRHFAGAIAPPPRASPRRAALLVSEVPTSTCTTCCNARHQS